MKKYDDEQLKILLSELLSYPNELRWLEWKYCNDDPAMIGKYISALANSACVENREFGYMIWGIENATRAIKGTHFDPAVTRKGNQPLEIYLKVNLKPDIAFDFYRFEQNGKNIVILEVEAAYRQPIMWLGEAYIRIGEALTELRKHPDLEAKIYRTVGKDWSAETVVGASLDDLDSNAIRTARERYSEKHRNDSFAKDIAKWSDEKFLNKAKLTIDGKITKAALILLGKPESAHWLNPSVARITWNLLDQDGASVDYKHFDPPLLLAVDQVFAKVRNITIRTMPDGTLFPVEISQYDSWVFREALHNCIAHQDYALCRNIVVAEYPDRVQFSNMGAFAPVTLEKALNDDGRPRFYLNRQLTEAMVELNMIDTIGSGIKRMFRLQQKRYMPMPDYIISTAPEEMVRVVLFGKILDERYTRLLMRQADLTLNEIILLDKLQKSVRIPKAEADQLRKKKLIEGRYPRIYPAAEIALKTARIEEYLENRAFDDSFYLQKILQYICLKGRAKRADIVNLLKKHLSATLTEEEQNRKISNWLSVTLSSRKKLIHNTAGRGGSCWVLTAAGAEQCRKYNPSCRKTCKTK